MFGFRPQEIEIDPRVPIAGRNLPEGKRQQARVRRANGGPVRGPGTGTSDDVPVDLPVGAYVMPADSTRKIGEENLSGLGFNPNATIPAAVSNGEYILPPEQVAAVGARALDAVRNATHAPAAAQEDEENALNFRNGGACGWKKGRVRLDDGGLADEQKIRQVSRSQPSFGEEVQSIGSGIASGFSNFMERGKERPIQPRPPEYYNSHDAGEADQFSVQGSSLGNPPPSAASPSVVNPAPSAAQDAPSSPAVAPATNPAAPNASTAPTNPAASASEDGITRSGVGSRGQATSYSGSFPAPAAAPGSSPQGQGFGFNPTGMNLDAFGNNMDRTNAMKAQLAGLQAQNAPTGMDNSGPRIATLGDSSQEDRERAAVFSGASNPYAGSQNRQLTANQLRVLAGIREGYEKRDMNATNNAAAMQREQMQQTGANNRQAAQNALDWQRAQPAMEGQGLQNALARRQNTVLSNYDAAMKSGDEAAIKRAREEMNLFVKGGAEKSSNPWKQLDWNGKSKSFNTETGAMMDTPHVDANNPAALEAIRKQLAERR